MALQKSDGGSTRLISRSLPSDAIEQDGPAYRRGLATHEGPSRCNDDALAKALPGAMVRKPEGGYFPWVELPEGMSGDALACKVLWLAGGEFGSSLFSDGGSRKLSLSCLYMFSSVRIRYATAFAGWG